MKPLGIFVSALDAYTGVLKGGPPNQNRTEKAIFSTQCQLSRIHLLAARTILSATV